MSKKKENHLPKQVDSLTQGGHGPTYAIIANLAKLIFTQSARETESERKEGRKKREKLVPRQMAPLTQDKARSARPRNSL